MYYLVAKRRFLSTAAPSTDVYIHKCLPSALVPRILGKKIGIISKSLFVENTVELSVVVVFILAWQNMYFCCG